MKTVQLVERLLKSENSDMQWHVSTKFMDELIDEGKKEHVDF
jgi:hypothetical protein